MKSKRYLQINSSELKKQCDGIITGLGFTFDCKLVKRRSTKHTLIYKIDTEMKVMGDVVKPLISITNSYRGESSLEIRFGFFRLVCTNGMMVSTLNEEGENTNVIKIRHTNSVKNQEKVKQLEFEIAAILKQMVGTISEMEKELSKPMTVEKQIEVVEKLPLPKRVKKVVLERLAKPCRKEDEGNTVWTVWNIINESNRVTSRTENAALTRDESLFGNIMRLAA